MKIGHFVTVLIHFICAALPSAVIAILMHTQMVLVELNKIDISISIADRLYMSWQDLIGLLPKYGLVVIVGLAIAFIVTKGILKLTRKKSHIARLVLYPIGGGVAMLAIILSMQPILDITLLAGARTTTGIILQIIAGVIGGFVFAQLRNKHQQTNHSPK